MRRRSGRGQGGVYLHVGPNMKARDYQRWGEKPRCDAFLQGQDKRCRSTDLMPNGRCRLHGGVSTGPRTPEGKARALEALQAINARRKREKS